MIPDRSSPSRVRFAASRPGLLRADPGDALFMRERGDTDQPHIDWGEASGLIFGWTLLGYASC